MAMHDLFKSAVCDRMTFGMFACGARRISMEKSNGAAATTKASKEGRKEGMLEIKQQVPLSLNCCCRRAAGGGFNCTSERKEMIEVWSSARKT